MKETISLTEKEYTRLLINNQRLLDVYRFLEDLDEMNLEKKGDIITEESPIMMMSARDLILKIKEIAKYPANKRATWLMAMKPIRQKWISSKSFMGLRISRKL